jgi:hypothetical protein
MGGKVTIVSGTLTNMGTYRRFRIKVISVETAAENATNSAKSSGRGVGNRE